MVWVPEVFTHCLNLDESQHVAKFSNSSQLLSGGKGSRFESVED